MISFRDILAAGSLAMASACQLTPNDALPAVLADDSPETMATLKSTLAEAVGRANIELGAGDPTQSPTISVLPPPLGPMETASTAMPTVFTLMMEGETCMAVHSESGEKYPMDLPCRPAEG